MTAPAATLPRAGQLPTEPMSWANFPAFMERQFPVSKVSKESYKERKAVAGQTLTGLGKWWGRKPLVLVRATVLGLLLPSTDDAVADRATFLALMTMDDDGMIRRVKGGLTAAKVYERCTGLERAEYFDLQETKPRWKGATAGGERQRLQQLAFRRMNYDEKLEQSLRPEEIDGPGEDAWLRINTHLGTDATNLPELVQQLGQRRFGHTPRVADAFCGGGSIPFEAARIGCDAYASDLNPVAALLTWGALNIVGGGPDVAADVKQAQRRVYEAVKAQVADWGIERNEEGWTADAYLYCVEVVDPSTGWRVPLSPSWVVAEKTKVIVRLLPDPANKRFDFEVVEGVSEAELKAAVTEGTWSGGVMCPVDKDGRWLQPAQRSATPMEQVKGRSGLRMWDAADIVPRPGDVMQERLYCVRWVDAHGKRHYSAPTPNDLQREELVLELLRERVDAWQRKGLIPTRAVEAGSETDRLPRERGWTHWSHLFNPRQLLLNGLFAETTRSVAEVPPALLLMVGRVAESNARLARWQPGQGGGIGGTKGVFYNQALNPLLNYGARTVATFSSNANITLSGGGDPVSSSVVTTIDARVVGVTGDLWITDPGYADSVNYGELSEFFLAWYEKRLPELFPDWYTDSKRALAVEGAGDDFRKAMVECYSNFARHMPDNGFQVVMFTHQGTEVWADLALILWAAGLQVSAAWTVATETGAAGIREGNYVQGTVLLVLRKRTTQRAGSLMDVFPELQTEVHRQIATMRDIDDGDDPNFGDADYQLAAYAASLRVLTSYSAIDEIDIARELTRVRKRGEKTELEKLISKAKDIASTLLVPRNFESGAWRALNPEERFYIKGIDVEAHGEYKDGVYTEFARGFGVHEYQSMLASSQANRVRLKSPTEMRGEAREGSGKGLAGSLLRHVLFAIYSTARHPEHDPGPARDYLKAEAGDYWAQREQILALLAFLAEAPQPDSGMPQWKEDAAAARLLRGRIAGDSM